MRADEENRTPVASLEGWSPATRPHPHCFARILPSGGSRILFAFCVHATQRFTGTESNRIRS